MNMQKSPNCPSCQCIFSTKDVGTGWQHKNPLLLACGHTFCAGCLTKIAHKEKTSLTCPSCKVATTLPPDGEGSVRSLHPDVYVTGYIMCTQRSLLNHELGKLKPAGMMTHPQSIKAPPDARDKICRECTMKLAICKCDRCDFIMCSQCFYKIHSTSNALKQHKAIPLESLKSNDEVTAECHEHPNRLLEYFCEEDNQAICSKCVIEGLHKSHAIVSMEEKNKALLSEIEPALVMASKVVRKIKGSNQTVNGFIPDAKQETFPVIQDIHEHFQHLHGVLQAREHQLVEEVISLFRKGTEPLLNLKSCMQEESQKLEKAIKAAQQILNNNCEVVLNAKEVLDQLTNAKNVPCIIKEKEEQDSQEKNTKIIFTPDDSFDGNLSTYGKVEGGVQIRAEWHTPEEMPDEFRDDDNESIGNMTSQDSNSVISVSETMSSDDVIIEDEQDFTVGGVEVGPKGSKNNNNISSRPNGAYKGKSKQKKADTNKYKSGTGEHIYITHLKNPCSFAVHRASDVPQLKSLGRNLNNWGNSPMSDREVPQQINPGDLVIARYTSDNSWYRARVKKVNGIDKETMTVDVFYIDYGNSESITTDRIKKMQPRFEKLPNFLTECCLFDIIPTEKLGWSTEAVETFHKMTTRKRLFMSIIREENGILMVDLNQLPLDEAIQDTPISVRDALVFLELANFISPACGNLVGMPAFKREFLKPEPRFKGDTFEVLVSYGGTPSSFYIQELGENSECIYFAQHMKEMQEDYKRDRGDQLTIYCPKIGMVCCCQYSADNAWYRAVVLDLPGHKQVHVQYVDFGNDEIVPYWRLRILLDKYLMLPPQAMKCTLVDVEPSNPVQIWSAEALQWWSTKVTMKQFIASVCGVVLDSGILEVTLSHLRDQNGYTINGEMVTLGHANSTGDGSKPVPLEFCNQDPRSSSDSSSLDYDLPSSQTTSLPSSKSVTPASTPVPSPTKAASAGSRTPPTRGAVDKDETPTAKSPGKTKSPKKANDIDLKIDIEKAVREGSLSNPSPAKSLGSESDKEMVEVKVGYFASPSEFFVNLAKDVGQLDKLMIDMEYYHQSKHTKSDWKLDDYCAVLNPNDSKWYRARVVNDISLSSIQVFLEDYGYKIDVSSQNLRSLKKDHLKRDKVGFLCHLSDVLPAGDVKRWSRTACEFMQAEMKNKKLFVKQRGEGIPGCSLPIDILVEEDIPESALEPAYKQYYSITEKIREHGLGIPRRKSKKSIISLKEEPKFTTSYKYPPAVLPKDNSLVAIPVYVDFDGVFYVQEVRQDNELEEITNKLQAKFTESEPHKPGEVIWEEGQACVAQFHLDNKWYRGTILQLESHRVKVKYVDYGNVEFVGFDKLRADIEEFTLLPVHCFKCVLANTAPADVGGKWPRQVLNFMHESVVGKGCVIDIKKRNEDANEAQSINLMLPDKRDLSALLVELKLAVRPDDIGETLENSFKISKILQKKNPYKRPPRIPIGEYFPVMVLAVEVPNVVYYQYVRSNGQESDDYVDEINAQLGQLEIQQAELNLAAPQLPAIKRPRPGLPCCAQWWVDQAWYRGVIISVVNHVSDLLIQFVDFGNSEVISIEHVRELSPVFTHLPAQASRLKLYDVCMAQGEKSWTKSVWEEMSKCVQAKELICCLRSHEPLQGDLFVNENKDWASLELAYQDLIDDGIIQSKDDSRIDLKTSGLDEDSPVNKIQGSVLTNADVIIENISDSEEDFD